MSDPRPDAADDGEGLDGLFSQDDIMRRVCAVCARVLDYSPITGWAHARQDPDDHPVVPVLDGEVVVRGRCDFCSAEPVFSMVVSAPLQMLAVTDGPGGEQALPLRSADATWACCAVCDRLIRKNRWPRVTERAIRAMAARQDIRVDAVLIDAMRDLHETVASNMVGRPVRIDANHGS